MAGIEINICWVRTGLIRGYKVPGFLHRLSNRVLVVKVLLDGEELVSKFDLTKREAQEVTRLVSESVEEGGGEIKQPAAYPYRPGKYTPNKRLIRYIEDLKKGRES